MFIFLFEIEPIKYFKFCLNFKLKIQNQLTWLLFARVLLVMIDLLGSEGSPSTILMLVWSSSREVILSN